ncbi:MAG: Membrane associated protein [Parcubacteria group bacterium GW2011_GWC2_42_12]|nr:MAG: Membrane associated protein [Parcubacteria group bacterium GW2011_GWC2_42_12]
MNKRQKILAVFGGALAEDKHGHWHTTFYEIGDNFGICGGGLRVKAAGYLYKDKQCQAVIASGGKGQLKKVLPGKITLASIIKDELIKVGIPAKNIIKEERSGNTYQQLKELQKIIMASNFKDIIIISNRYHLPRLRAMIRYAGDLRALKKMFDLSRLEIKSAEDVVIEYQPKIWSKIINRVYKSRAMTKRIKLENQGTGQIKRGVYQFK